MLEVNTNCPYLCSDCYELGCAFCDIDEQLKAMDETELEIDED